MAEAYFPWLGPVSPTYQTGVRDGVVGRAEGAVPDEGQAPWEFDPGDKVALVLGSEGSGVRRGLLDRLDFRVRVPMHKGMESLNVSIAGAAILYEWLARPQKH